MHFCNFSVGDGENELQNNFVKSKLCKFTEQTWEEKFAWFSSRSFAKFDKFCKTSPVLGPICEIFEGRCNYAQ